jgi:hypothetical protein
MPVIKKVIITKTQTCDKCKDTIQAGNIAVKSRKEKGKTKYYHTTCVK